MAATLLDSLVKARALLIARLTTTRKERPTESELLRDMVCGHYEYAF